MEVARGDERDVGAEIDARAYRVQFWDLDSSRSTTYDVTEVGHVSELLEWVWQQIGAGGTHVGCHPEIGVLIAGDGPRRTFVRLTPDYWVQHADGQALPPPLPARTTDLATQIIFSGIPTFAPSGFVGSAQAQGLSQDSDRPIQIRVQLADLDGRPSWLVTSGRIDTGQGRAWLKTHALMALWQRTRSGQGRDSRSRWHRDMHEALPALEAMTPTRTILTVDGRPREAHLLDVEASWALWAAVDETTGVAIHGHAGTPVPEVLDTVDPRILLGGNPPT